MSSSFLLRGIARFIVFSLFLPVLLCAGAQAAEPVTMFNAVLMQPSAVYQERLASSDAMAAYIKEVEAAIKAAVDHAGTQPPEGGFIVIALRPGQRSNAWLDFDDPVPDAFANDLVGRIRSVFPIKVKGGQVVFALKVGLWGGKEPSRTKPYPKEWREAQQKSLHPLDMEEILEQVWKE
jgi:hypothetical protein